MSKLSLSVERAAKARVVQPFIAVPTEIRVPDEIGEMAASLDALGGAINAGGWATAAVVYAWTEPAQGQRSDLGEKSPRLTLARFAELGIRGLTTRNTVRKYRESWERAIDAGWAAPAMRGETVALPSEDFQPEAQRIESGDLPSLPSGSGYSLVYADPPWPMPDWIPSRAVTRHHYGVKSVEELLSWPVASVLADDAVLYLWAISTHLPDAFDVMRAWGFEYVAQMVWVKPDIGTGWWVRHQHELLLIGRRGDVSPPAPASRPSSVIEAPTGRHSEKPDAVADMLDRLWPDARRVELFGRKPRVGWDVIGDDPALLKSVA